MGENLLSLYSVSDANSLGKDGVVGSIPIGSTSISCTFQSESDHKQTAIYCHNESRTWGTRGGFSNQAPPNEVMA